jgi:hypothetical protein
VLACATVMLLLVSAALVSAPISAASAPASALPQPAGYNRLSGVSCASAPDCWAVGSAQNSSTNESVGETLHWDGAQWIAVSSPSVPRGLSGVSCTSSSNCWAVGDDIAIRWNGTGRTKVPTPQAPYAYLNDVHCISRADCWAVGAYGRRSPKTFALHWNGSRWLRVGTPNPGKLQSDLSAVTCIAASNCWALGYYYTLGPGQRLAVGYTMAVHWNGTGWKRVWTSAPYYGGDVSVDLGLHGLSCTSSANCLAVGWSGINGVTTSSVGLRWNGSRWEVIKTPRIHNAQLWSLDCSSGRDCWAVGSVRNLGGTNTVAEHWNGSDWSEVTTPRGSASLAGVSCTPSRSCWAVGTLDVQNGNLNLALRWNGNSWARF